MMSGKRIDAWITSWSDMCQNYQRLMGGEAYLEVGRQLLDGSHEYGRVFLSLVPRQEHLPKIPTDSRSVLTKD